MIDDDDDLFAVRPRPARRSAKRTLSETEVAPQPEPKIEPICQPAPVPVVSAPDHVPAAGDMVRQPARRVASFTCYCGGQDEVREPAPDLVDCWNCGKWQGMRRWQPKHEAPFVSARVTTDEERSRL